jgi:hypothetical protein
MLDIKKLKEQSKRRAAKQERKAIKSTCRYINREIRTASREGASHASIYVDFDKELNTIRVRNSLAKIYTEYGFKVKYLDAPYHIALQISWEED